MEKALPRKLDRETLAWISLCDRNLRDDGYRLTRSPILISLPVSEDGTLVLILKR